MKHEKIKANELREKNPAYMKITSAIIICWSHEDQVFVADVPELPGCIAHGKTHEAAPKNAKGAIRLWLDTAKEFGDPIPEPQGRRLMLA